MDLCYQMEFIFSLFLSQIAVSLSPFLGISSAGGRGRSALCRSRFHTGQFASARDEGKFVGSFRNSICINPILPEKKKAKESSPTMSHAPVQGTDRQPLLAPQDTVVDINAHHDHEHDHVHLHIRASEAPKDRLQHHRAMVQDRFSFNWWFEWIIIIVRYALLFSLSPSLSLLHK